MTPIHTGQRPTYRNTRGRPPHAWLPIDLLTLRYVYYEERSLKKEKKEKRWSESDVLKLFSRYWSVYCHRLITNVRCEVKEERSGVIELLMCEKDQGLQSNQTPGSREHMAPS